MLVIGWIKAITGLFQNCNKTNKFGLCLFARHSTKQKDFDWVNLINLLVYYYNVCNYIISILYTVYVYNLMLKAIN